MERIRIQNLRCLADTPSVEIKPITILVGANSSGKSTFLRVFPLLKQSVETKTLSGITLNEDYVNFGFFPEAIHKDATPQQMRFSFSLTLQHGLYQGGYANRFLSGLGQLPVTCEVAFAARTKDNRYPYLQSVKIVIEKSQHRDTIEIDGDEDGKVTRFQVNDYKANGEAAHLRLRVGRCVIPTLANTPTTSAADSSPKRTPTLIDDDDEDDFLDAGPFDRKLLHETNVMFHGKTTRANRLTILRNIRLDSPTAMLDRAKRLDGGTTWNSRVSNWTVTSSGFLTTRNLIIARHVGDILTGINRYVTALSESVHYFQPVRASVLRDYTSRDVPVSSVDPTGQNVAMVLRSLGPTARSEFRSWLLKHFGFEVYPVEVGDGARVALRMREAGSESEFNLADMGFGFSQMLPFLVQIWYVVEYEPEYGEANYYRYYSVPNAIPTNYIVAIEQPELHLHPGLQSKLADLFVNIVKVSNDKKIPVRFILETHSQTLIERIGAHVEANSALAKDVQVLLFEREAKSGKSNRARVRKTEFDDQGVLKEWPFGFLDPLPPPIHKAPVPTEAQ